MNLRGEKVKIKITNEEGVVIGKDKGLYMVYVNDNEGQNAEIRNYGIKDLEVRMMENESE